MSASTTPSNASDWAAMMGERRASEAADKAYAAARSAFASKAKDDVLRAGDLFRYAAALYEQAATLWKARGPTRKSFADHCASMAKSLLSSEFARRSLAATYQHIDPDA